MLSATVLVCGIAAVTQSTTITVSDETGSAFVGAYVWVSSGLSFKGELVRLGPTEQDGRVTTEHLARLDRAYVKATPTGDAESVESSAIQKFLRTDPDYPPRSISIELRSKSICFSEKIVYETKVIDGRQVTVSRRIREQVACSEKIPLKRFDKWIWHGCHRIHAGTVWLDPREAERLNMEACSTFALCDRCGDAGECRCGRHHTGKPVARPTNVRPKRTEDTSVFESEAEAAGDR